MVINMIDTFFADNYDESQEILQSMAIEEIELAYYGPIYVGSGEDLCITKGLLFPEKIHFVTEDNRGQ